MLRVDIHVHTAGASRCSRMSVGEYVERFRALDLPVVTVTNHGDLSDNEAVRRAAEDDGRLFVPGIEVSTNYGDFLVFAESNDYLKQFNPTDLFPLRVDREAVAIVWAHPAAGGGMTGARFDESFPERVLPHIDAIEVYNGNLVYHNFVDTQGYGGVNELAHGLAESSGLPGVGGSDSHHPETLMRCFTLLPSRPNDAADFIEMIKNGEVQAGRFDGTFGREDETNDGVLRDLFAHMQLDYDNWPPDDSTWP